MGKTLSTQTCCDTQSGTCLLIDVSPVSMVFPVSVCLGFFYLPHLFHVTHLISQTFEAEEKATHSQV